MNKFNVFLLLGLLVIFPFFFVGGPDYYSSRLFKGLWDFGHIVFFVMATYLLLKNSKTIATKSFLFQLIILSSAGLVVGVVIEILQYEFSRNTDMSDVFRDAIGVVLGVAWFSPERKTINKKFLLVIKAMLVSLLFLQSIPLLLVGYDEWQASNNFPVLADFESSLELGRWKGNAEVSLSDEQKISGNHSLKIQFSTQQYSGVRLEYFPTDWLGYRQLIMEANNPGDQPLWITTRINDEKHHEGEQLYGDRFNRKFLLQQGWNTIVIDLSEVEKAPENRAMVLSAIAGFGLFVTAENRERTLFLDNVRLIKAKP